MRIVFRTLSFLLLPMLSSSIYAQSNAIKELWLKQLDTAEVSYVSPMYLHVEPDKMLERFNKEPSFGIYRDNYFISGIPTNKAINKTTADAKFQISIRQRITNSLLPFNTLLMITYTQKSFWDIYEHSAPFADNNYNPGLIFITPFIHNSRLKGLASLAFEHESNGKPGEDSRSWNYLTISGVHFVNLCFSVQAKLWYGWLGEENTDLFTYKGYGMVALSYRSVNDRLGCSVIINPRGKFLSFNTQLDLTYKLSDKSNQYFFLQWYNGYAEGLLAYNQYRSMVRFGICITPPIRHIY